MKEFIANFIAELLVMVLAVSLGMAVFMLLVVILVKATGWIVKFKYSQVVIKWVNDRLDRNSRQSGHDKLNME